MKQATYRFIVEKRVKRNAHRIIATVVGIGLVFLLSVIDSVLAAL